MTTKSKVDVYIWIFPITAGIFSVMEILFDEDWTRDMLICFGLTIVLFYSFLFSNMYTIRYSLTEDELVIKTWMFRTVVKLDKLEKIERTNSGGYSFLAASREQLKLICKNGTKVRISPENLEEFEESLRKNMNR